MKEANSTREEFLNHILAASLCGIYVYNIVEGRNEFINQQYTHITGWTLDEINRMSREVFASLFHPDDQEHVFAHMQAVPQMDDDQVLEIEYRFKTKAGAWIWCLSRDTTFDRSEDGTITHFIGTFLDITARKKMEETQQRLNEELAASNKALTQSNIDLQQFAHIASHDLQAPLLQISGFAQLLQNTYKGKLSEQADTWIDYTINGIERMQTLIRDVLTFSRVESRSRSFEPVALRAVFDDVVGLLASSIADTGARVTCDDLPTVIADRSQMTQLMQNLIGNSLKYHSDKPPHVHVSAEKSGDEWIVSVQDNGIGIALKHHEKIFEIFNRLHTQRMYPGTGIGLAVCQRIAQRHGGRIGVESESGAGATFYFTLPDRRTQHED